MLMGMTSPLNGDNELSCVDIPSNDINVLEMVPPLTYSSANVFAESVNDFQSDATYP